MEDIVYRNYRTYLTGILSVAAGVVAMMIVSTIMFAGPFDPQPKTGTLIGEIAADIKLAAKRRLQGDSVPQSEQTVVERPWSVDRVLSIVGPVFAVAAIVLSLVSLLRREPRQLQLYGAGFGIAALTIQIFWWALLVVLGVAIIIAIINNIGDIVS